MPAKTFVPQLIRIVRTVCIYTTRYEAQIRRNIPVQAVPAFNAMTVACDAFLTVMGDLPVNP